MGRRTHIQPASQPTKGAQGHTFAHNSMRGTACCAVLGYGARGNYHVSLDFTLSQPRFMGRCAFNM